MRALFTFAIFLGSALLFLVQPLVAKLILPRFGGAPAVWTACLLFFQASLLLGYLYAHAGSKLAPRVQAAIHVALIALAVISLPFALPSGIGALGSANPTLAVLGILARCIGLPFLLVSAGAPMLQRWFSKTDDPQARDPYFLYAASNVGSMLGLLSYPFLLEPALTLKDQSRLWTYGYIALIFAIGITAFIALRRPSPERDDQEAPEPRPNPRPWLWIVLGAVPASLLTGVTNYVTSNVAPIPLLWVVPLALYLLTFILAFARRPLTTSAKIARWLPIVATPLALVLVLEATQPLVPMLAFHLVVFFMAAWMCHSRLVESRPDARHLTSFYLYMSLGGVIGGAFNALLAPVIFRSLAEYPIAIVCALLLRPPSKDGGIKRADWVYPLALAALTFGLVFVSRQIGLAGTTKGTMIAIGIPVILAFVAGETPLRYGLAMGAVLFVSNLANTASTGQIAFIDRSFFGVHRVEDDGTSFSLVHGTTRHGRQFKAPDLRDTPLTYYSRSGPIGRVFDYYAKHQPLHDVALVGMGVGTLSIYGEPGERMTYFEIDPVVDRIAHDTRFFTYLRDSKAQVDTVLGDARLTLAEAPDNHYDLIVLDAFSSDAIPVHLLTREAVQAYLTKLRPGGLLAFHISNNYLDLQPVLTNVAGSLGLIAYFDNDEETSEPGKEASTWLVMGRNQADLRPAIGWEATTPDPNARVWTDDFSNILSAFKR